MRAVSTLPRLRLAPDVEVITISFVPPVLPESGKVLELRSPSADVLASATVRLAPDRLGRVAFAWPAHLFTVPGRYEIVLRDPAGGEERSFAYPFLVERAGP